MKIRNILPEFKIAGQPDPKDAADYKEKMKTLQQIQNDPKMRDPQTQATIAKRKEELRRWAEKNMPKNEDAPFDGMGLVRMALMRKFITAEEWHGLKDKWKDAVEELEQKYDDWPEDQGFGSSDHAYAIKELMELVGYEFDDQDTSGRFVVSKMPPELEKMGIKNARMKDAVTTDEDAGDMDLIGDGAKNLGLDPNKFDYYYDTSGAGYGEVRTKKSGKTILQFEYDRDGDAEVSMDNKTIANIKQGEQLPINVISKLNMMKEDADVDAQFKSDVLQFLNSKVVQIEKQIELAPANTPEEKENKEFALKLFNFVQAKLEQKDNGDNTITVPKSFKKD